MNILETSYNNIDLKVTIIYRLNNLNKYKIGKNTSLIEALISWSIFMKNYKMKNLWKTKNINLRWFKNNDNINFKMKLRKNKFNKNIKKEQNQRNILIKS